MICYIFRALNLTRRVVVINRVDTIIPFAKLCTTVKLYVYMLHYAETYSLLPVNKCNFVLYPRALLLFYFYYLKKKKKNECAST